MVSEILSSMTLIIEQQSSGSHTTCEHGTCMGVRLGIGECLIHCISISSRAVQSDTQPRNVSKGFGLRCTLARHGETTNPANEKRMLHGTITIRDKHFPSGTRYQAAIP